MKFIKFLLFIVPLFIGVQSASAAVVISEVEYDPPLGGNTYEWIELYNNGVVSVDLENWTIADTAGNTAILPAFALAAGEYAILANNATNFAIANPGVTADIDLTPTVGLNNGAETLTLSDGATTIDFIAWEGGAAGWNLAANAGESFCRIDDTGATSTPADFQVCSNPTPGAPTTTGPANVNTAAVLWLRADSGSDTTTNGANVTLWQDQSGNNNNAVGLSANGGSARPTYVSSGNLHNFNPTMSFTGGDNSSTDAPYFDIPDGFNDFTGGGSYFSVSKSTAIRQWSRIFDFGQNNDDDNIWLGRQTTSSNIIFETLDGSIKNNLIASGDWTDNTTDILAVSHASGAAGTMVTANLYKNGETLITDNQVSVPNNVVRDKNYIARSNWSADDLFEGEISEIVMYNRELSATEKASVESYLALKYGITLDNSVGDYLNTLGGSVYDLSSYTNHIVGLAKDRDLDQRVAASQETGSVITIATTNDFTSANGGARTQMADGEYVVLGSDNGATASLATIIPDYENKIVRQWRAELTNYTGSVNLKFDIPAISGNDWDIVQSDTSDFSDAGANLTKVGDVTATGEALNVTLSDGKFYSVMEVDVDTIAPTIALVSGVTPTPTTNTTPDIIFSSDEVGTITYGGACSSATTAAVNGNNTITLNALAAGTYTDCTVTVTDAASNISTVLMIPSFEISAANTSSSSRKSGSRVVYVCKNSEALNYSRFGRHKESLCEYGTVTTTTAQILTTNTSVSMLGSGNQCSVDMVLTQNMKASSRDGQYNSYTAGIVREAKILQQHMNRLGFDAGPEDGIIGPLTNGAIKRMQIFLGTNPDGYVGPITRSLINNSC